MKGANIPLIFLTWIAKKNVIIKLEKCNVQRIDTSESENVTSWKNSLQALAACLIGDKLG